MEKSNESLTLQNESILKQLENYKTFVQSTMKEPDDVLKLTELTM
jgi:hypothetical protein